MYPSSASSSSQGSMGPTTNLMRYGSVICPTPSLGPHHSAPAVFFPFDASEKSTRCDVSDTAAGVERGGIGLQRSYGFSAPGSCSGSSSSPSLVRHGTSPAGFLNQLASSVGDNGFSITRGIGTYNSKGIADNNHGIARLNSQLSFTRQEDLSRISVESEDLSVGVSTNNGERKSSPSYSSNGFAIGSWDDSNATLFSVGPSRRQKAVGGIVVHDLDSMESQLHFRMPQGALEMATMDKLLHIPQDSVPCKIRAKRGCATHPRSIAERERRTRISGKLKKLQDLVPNMDKQTSYSDMLDLAVQHIRTLQNQVQKLQKDLDKCTCGCKKNMEDP